MDITDTRKDGAPLFLAIDLGTSGPKVALVSLTGDIIDSERGATDLYLLDGGGAEQSPDQWWQVICATTRRLMARHFMRDGQPIRHGQGALTIAAVCCTGQWSGTVPIDRQGQPLMNALTWMDARGAASVQRVIGGFPSIQGYGVRTLLRWIQLTGGVPTRSGKDTLAHILWLKAARPELYQQTHCFLEPKDYLNFKLTGVAATTYDTAALLWLTDNRDPNNIHYCDELIERVGVDRSKLPDLVASTHRLGTVLPEAAEQLGLPGHQPLPVIAGSPDIQSACIGSGRVADYDPHLYLGTSSWLSCHMPKKRTDLLRNMATLPAAVPGRYFLANEQETAGACLSYLHETFFSDMAAADLYPMLDEMVERVATTKSSVLFTPWLNGERTPVEDPHLRGGLHHLSLSTTKAQIVRAVYEGVALNSRWLKCSVEKMIRRPITQLACMGGGARSSVWCQLLADVLGCQIQQIKYPLDANARGAAWIAAVGIGMITFDDLHKYSEIEATFEPNRSVRALYTQRYSLFKQIHRSNRRIHKMMSKE